MSISEPNTVIAQWTETQWENPGFPTWMMISGAVLVAVLLTGIGYYQKEFTFYLAAVTALVAGITVSLQKRRPNTPLSITVTTSNIQIGENEYPLATLGGFWLERTPSGVVVNIEPSKAAIFPISFLYASSNSQEAHDLMLQVLPEVEPRQKSFADSVNRYFRI